MNLKGWFTFSGSEGRAIKVLLLLIVLLLTVRWCRETNTPDIYLPKEEARTEKADTLIAPPAEPLFDFDPNKLDSAGFRQLGIPVLVCSNIVKYRAKGGRFNQPSDFGKIYGLSTDLYARLLPYIHIPTKKNETKTAASSSNHEKKAAVFIKEKVELVKVELNSADSLALIAIKGIGPAYAGAILRYRDRLGGFVSLSQLKEIALLQKRANSINEGWFDLDPSIRRRLNLNKADFKTVARHPYVGYEGAKAIFAYKRKFGNITSLDDLLLSPPFNEELLEKLSDYVVFE